MLSKMVPYALNQHYYNLQYCSDWNKFSAQCESFDVLYTEQSELRIQLQFTLIFPTVQT